MANKKTTRTKKQTKPVRKINKETAIAILIVASILSAVLIYFKSGIVGKTLSDTLGGVMGIVKYVIPTGIFAIAINCIHNKKDYITSKLMQYTIILCCLSTVFSIYEIGVAKSIVITGSFQNAIERAYYLGVTSKGGGAIGTAIAIPLIKLLGVPGTVILTIGLALIFIIFMFGIKPSEIITNIMERIKERRLAIQEEYAEEEENKAKSKQNVVETKRERRLREKEEKRRQAEEIGQLQINFGGANKDVKSNNLNENEPATLKTRKAVKKGTVDDPEYIEGNLFKQEDEKKQDNKKEVLQLEHAVAVEDEHYEYPPINLLSKNSKKVNRAGAKALTDTATKLQKTLYSFGVSAKVEDISVGPAITRYELKPAEGVRVSKIANLADDIALNLAAETIRIEAPIPGKQAVRN